MENRLKCLRNVETNRIDGYTSGSRPRRSIKSKITDLDLFFKILYKKIIYFVLLVLKWF